MHREDFELRLARFTHSDAYSVSRQDVTEDEKRRWIFHVHREPPLIRWGALIGECLFNYRSALDHLAFDLAVAHSCYPLPPRVEEKSEFPIFWRRAPKTRDLDDRIGAVHPEARRLIEQMQPHGRTGRAALKYLDALHNFDKHRTLHLVVAQNTGVAYYGDLLDFVDFVNFGPLKDGDPLAQIPLRDARHHDQDPNFHFGVAFSQSGPGAKAPDVETTLRWIGEHIEKSVIEPLRPFL
jgi:hypothetical protein